MAFAEIIDSIVLFGEATPSKTMRTPGSQARMRRVFSCLPVFLIRFFSRL